MAFPNRKGNCTFESLLIKPMFRKEMLQINVFIRENLIFV